MTLIALPINVVNAEEIQDNYYFVTEIEYIEETVGFRATNTKTAKKTSTCKDSAGQSLWSVTVTGTFSYTGSSSTCTSSSVSTNVYYSAWKINSSSSSKSGNTATAQATAYQYSNGVNTGTLSRTVSLSCSKDGTIS